MVKKRLTLRSSVAWLVIFSLTLSFLPDSLLDFFHQHKHVHCERDWTAQLKLESEHIHCEFPDLFIDFYQNNLPIFSHYWVVLHIYYPIESNTPIIHPAWNTCGRSPPLFS